MLRRDAALGAGPTLDVQAQTVHAAPSVGEHSVGKLDDPSARDRAAALELHMVLVVEARHHGQRVPLLARRAVAADLVDVQARLVFYEFR